jgi:hypothetical protein
MASPRADGRPRRPPSSSFPNSNCQPAWLHVVHSLTRFNVDPLIRLKVPFCNNERWSRPLRVGPFSRQRGRC